MKLNGHVWRDGNFWLVEVPLLHVMTQGKSRKDALFMIEDALKMLIYKKEFECEIIPVTKNTFHLASKSTDLLIPFALRRLRLKNGLSIRQVADRLGHKSHTTYARYESGKVKTPLGKFSEFVAAIELENDLILDVG